jgi:hypothetical protein
MNWGRQKHEERLSLNPSEVKQVDKTRACWAKTTLSENFPRQHDLDRVLGFFSDQPSSQTPLFHP